MRRSLGNIRRLIDAIQQRATDIHNHGSASLSIRVVVRPNCASRSSAESFRLVSGGTREMLLRIVNYLRHTFFIGFYPRFSDEPEFKRLLARGAQDLEYGPARCKKLIRRRIPIYFALRKVRLDAPSKFFVVHSTHRRRSSITADGTCW